MSTVYSLVEANFRPRAYAVWTRNYAKEPWKFHSAYATKAEAQKQSQGLSYRYDVRVTKEGYGKSPVRGAERTRSPRQSSPPMRNRRVDRALHDHVVRLANEYTRDVLARREVGDSKAEYHAQRPKVKAYAALIHAGLTPREAIAYFRSVSMLPSPVRGAERTKLLRIHNAVSKKLYAKSPLRERVIRDANERFERAREKFDPKRFKRGGGYTPEDYATISRMAGLKKPPSNRAKGKAELYGFLTRPPEKLFAYYKGDARVGDAITNWLGDVLGIITRRGKETRPMGGRAVSIVMRGKNGVHYAGRCNLSSGTYCTLKRLAKQPKETAQRFGLSPGTGTPYWVKIFWSDGTHVNTTIHAKTLAGARRAAMHAGMRAAAQTHKGKPHRINFDRK